MVAFHISMEKSQYTFQHGIVDGAKLVQEI